MGAATEKAGRKTVGNGPGSGRGWTRSSKRDGDMAKKLFVGNLSWNTGDDGLYEAFSQFGEVTEAKVILDRETGRSRGFGFVTYATGEAGDDAISGMDGQDLDGRAIRVNEAQERRNSSGGGGYRPSW